MAIQHSQFQRVKPTAQFQPKGRWWHFPRLSLVEKVLMTCTLVAIVGTALDRGLRMPQGDLGAFTTAQQAVTGALLADGMLPR